MPKLARTKSKSGIYHIMMRGIDRQDIFHDDDRERFIETLIKVKKKSQCEIYGYCLMDNHVHLMLREGSEEVSQIMKRLGTSYAYWYNKKYERIGHLFQDRFKSENIEDDSYFLAVLRYIHQNPLKAKLANTIGEYAWSSYQAYEKLEKSSSQFIDKQFALAIFSAQNIEAIQLYIQYMNQPEYGKCLDDNAIYLLNQIEKSEKDKILRQLKGMEGSSIRQIERITGIDRNIVANA